MRKVFMMVILTIVSLSANAQDKLTFTSGKVLNVKVLDVSASELRYKMYDNPMGPVLIESLANIYYIKYQSGEMQIFNNNPVRTNRYVPIYQPENPYRNSSSSITTQFDLYFQDAWGAGFMLRKEINPYLGWNIIGISYMSSWYRLSGPDKNGVINVRLPGIRLYTPSYEDFRVYAEVNLGYTHLYYPAYHVSGNNYYYDGYSEHTNAFGLDFSAGVQVHRNIAIGYNLTYVTNSMGSAKTH